MGFDYYSVNYLHFPKRARENGRRQGDSALACLPVKPAHPEIRCGVQAHQSLQPSFDRRYARAQYRIMHTIFRGLHREVSRCKRWAEMSLCTS
jgi:hypothetical protein